MLERHIIFVRFLKGKVTKTKVFMEMEMDQIRDYSQFASSLKSERQNSSLFGGFTVEIWSTQLSFPVLKLFHFDCHFVSFLSLLESQCLVSYCKLINFTNFFFFSVQRRP